VRVATLASCVLGVLGTAGPISAQTIRGELLEESVGSPIDAAFLVLLDESGTDVAAALTNHAGRFILQAPGPGRYTIRAERIGYESFSTRGLSVEDGQTIEYRLTMPVRPIHLDALSVESERQCEIRPAEGLRAARVWEEARKALMAAAWTEEQSTFRFTTRMHRSTLDPETLRVLEEEAEILSGLSTNPFRALPVEELASLGYVRSLSKEIDEYYAPDAHVLLSDRFIDDHCFRVVDGDGETEGLVGMLFEPLLRDDRADVRGVLWLNRADAQLQFIEYGYENLPGGFQSDRVGGRVQFRILPSGAWIVDNWYIRMPVVESLARWENVGPPGPARRQEMRREHRLAAVLEEGGEVLVVADPSGNVTLGVSRTRPGRGALQGLVFDSTVNAPLSGATVSLLGTNHQATSDYDGRYVMSDVPAGEFYITFSHRKTTALRLGSVLQKATIPEGTVAEADLAVPPPRVLMPALCRDEDVSPESVLVGTVTDAGSGGPAAGVTVHVSTQILALLAASIEVESQALESARRFKTVTDEQGSFVFCDIPAGVRVYAGASVGPESTGVDSNVVYLTTVDGLRSTVLEIEAAAGVSGES
jgi:hypothetical protein